MRFADTETIQYDLVTLLEISVFRSDDGAAEIDSGSEWKFTYDRRPSGHRQAVLVIQGGVFDADRDISLHQITVIELRQRATLSVIVFANLVSLEPLRHLLNPCKAICNKNSC